VTDPGPCCCEYGVDCRRCAICERVNNRRRYDPLASCCPYAQVFEDEGLMPPIHDCPAPAPLEHDDFDAPLTALERELMRSLNLRVSVTTRRWV
jgi:hypothetical protein